MSHPFPEMKKKLGFGMMRLPMCDGKVDEPQTCAMVDAFLRAGFNYFDTAHGYLGGQSEVAIRNCLTSRYPRDAYLLTDKLSPGCFEKEEEIRPLFRLQLETCGVDYFDFYLLHANSRERHKFFKATRAYEIVQELKAEGKIRHVGMSFHDDAKTLDEILTAQPEIEVVQLQFNYADYIDPRVQSRDCYEVCRKHGKKVLVMEPVKGGSLVRLPEDILKEMAPMSPASYAIRFAASFDEVVMVLSGMSDIRQVEDNLGYMADFRPLSQQEYGLIDRARTAFQGQNRIPCTTCRYCTDGCPAGLDIPELFAILNDKRGKAEDADARYAAQTVRADACLECGQCEEVCPQHLHIRQLLKAVGSAFSDQS